MITTLGRVWIHVDSLMIDVQVYRERWFEHLAYVAGFNMFFYVIVRVLVLSIIKMHLTGSIKKDIAPKVVEEGDFMARKSKIR